MEDINQIMPDLNYLTYPFSAANAFTAMISLNNIGRETLHNFFGSLDSKVLYILENGNIGYVASNSNGFHNPVPLTFSNTDPNARLPILEQYIPSRKIEDRNYTILEHLKAAFYMIFGYDPNDRDLYAIIHPSQINDLETVANHMNYNLVDKGKLSQNI